MRLAAVQLRSPGGANGADEARERAAALVHRAAAEGADLAVLPELFTCLGRHAAMAATAEPLDGPTTAWASQLASDAGLWLVAGSFVERAGDDLYNTSCLLTPDGRLAGSYRKVHLFDVDVEGARSLESSTFTPGARPAVVPLSGADGEPVVGLTVCYDLRFPELYRIEALAGASVFVVPAAFTAATGGPHWEVLLRARAIENQVAVVAAGLWGPSADGIVRHGHSMVVDAWGTVVAEGPGEGDAVVVADIDAGEQATVRARLPSVANRRPDAYVWPGPALLTDAGSTVPS
jgi:predicted amidohydrolase